MIRPILARSGFVIFDRYYDDVQIDPQRYRYGGPLWLLGLLKPLVPKPDVTLILDAPEEVVLSRKQEVEPQELRRQRQRYTAYCSRGANTYLINSTSSIADVTAVAANVVMECLTQRSERRYARWLSGGKP
jgi:thymidylate kinase